MPPDRRRSKEQARHGLLRHRQMVRNWGLFALVAAIILGAIVAPRTTLLAVVLLGGLGAAGLAVGYGLRLINRLFTPPRP